MQTNGFLLPFFNNQKSIQVMHTMSAFQLQCLHFLCFVLSLILHRMDSSFCVSHWFFCIPQEMHGASITVGFYSVSVKAGVECYTIFVATEIVDIPSTHMKTHHLFCQDAAICCFMTKSQDTWRCCHNDSHYGSGYAHYVKRILLAIDRLAAKL